MALPPTYIYTYLKGSHYDIFSSLKNAGLLKKDVVLDNTTFFSDLKTAEDMYKADMSENTGENIDDVLAGALRPFLNKNGLFLADTESLFSTKKEKIYINLMKLKCRLAYLIGIY